MPAAAASSGPSRVRILAVTGAAHGLDHASDEAFPPTLRAVGADFDLGDATLGAIEALRGGFFGLLALPAGILTMRGHANALILLSLAGIGGTALLAAAAPGPVTFAAALASLGIAAGLYHPPGLTVVSTITEKRGRALALHGVMGNLGIASAPLLGFLVQWGHWRIAFVALGLLGIVAGLGALRLPRVAAAGAAAHARSGQDAGPLWVPFAATAILLFGAGFSIKAVKTFLNKNVEVALDIAELPLKGAGGAGLLVAAAYVMGAFGQITGGRTLDRIAPDRSLAIYLSLAGVSCFAMAAVSGPLVILPAAAFTFFYFAGQPAGNELVARFIGPRWRGLGFGIHFTISFGLASVGSMVAGQYSQEGRMGTLFALCGTILAGAAALVLALRSVSARGRTALEGASR